MLGLLQSCMCCPAVCLQVAVGLPRLAFEIKAVAEGVFPGLALQRLPALKRPCEQGGVMGCAARKAGTGIGGSHRTLHRRRG